jgi:hypothetical protein
MSDIPKIAMSRYVSAVLLINFAKESLDDPPPHHRSSYIGTKPEYSFSKDYYFKLLHLAQTRSKKRSKIESAATIISSSILDEYFEVPPFVEMMPFTRSKRRS